MNMTEDQRVQVVRNMTQEEKEFLMNHFSKLNTALDENISDPMYTNDSKSLIGNFKDSSDGFHKVEGVAKVVDLEDGKTFLRLENLKATNGSALYLFLSTDRDASDFVNLGRLKGNMGNQNNLIPVGTGLKKFDSVLKWCRTFSVLIGGAQL
jgi:hypothetical protein